MGFMSLCSILQLKTGQEKRSRVFDTSGTQNGPTLAVCKLGQAGTNKPVKTQLSTPGDRASSTIYLSYICYFIIMNDLIETISLYTK